MFNTRINKVGLGLIAMIFAVVCIASALFFTPNNANAQSIRNDESNNYVQETFYASEDKVESENFIIEGHKLGNLLLPWVVSNNRVLTIKSKHGLKIEKIVVEGPHVLEMNISRGEVESYERRNHQSFINVNSEEATLSRLVMGSFSEIKSIEITASNS